MNGAPRFNGPRPTAYVACLLSVMLGGAVHATPTVLVTESVSTGGLTLFTFTVDPGSLQNGYSSIVAQTTDGLAGGGIFANTPGSFSQTDFLPLPTSLATAGSDDSGLINPGPTSGFIGIEESDTGSEVLGVISGSSGSNGISAGPFDFAQVAILPDADASGTYRFGLVEVIDGAATVIATVAGSFPAGAPNPPGDYTGDGLVNAADYTVWRDTQNTIVPAGSGADGIVDGADYTLWADNYGGPSTPALATPEPTALCSAMLPLAAWIVRRR